MFLGSKGSLIALFILLMNLGLLFVFACEKGSNAKVGKTCSKLLKELSANTLGVYVMHVGLMEYTMDHGFHSMIVSNIIGIPLYAMVCFIICALVAAVLRRIPFIGRFLC